VREDSHFYLPHLVNHAATYLTQLPRYSQTAEARISIDVRRETTL